MFDMLPAPSTHNLLHPPALPSSALQTARALAAAVIPNEYGIHPAGKLRIGSMICSQLLGKLLADLASMREESVQTAGLQHADNSLLVRGAGWGWAGRGRCMQQMCRSCSTCWAQRISLSASHSQLSRPCTARSLLQYDVMSDLGNLEVGSGSHGGASKRAVSAGSRSPSAAIATATIPEDKEGEEAEQEEQEQEEKERAAAAAATAAAAAAEDSAAASNQEEVVGTGRCDQQPLRPPTAALAQCMPRQIAWIFALMFFWWGCGGADLATAAVDAGPEDMPRFSALTHAPSSEAARALEAHVPIP
jgi:hypothetical protein